MRRDPLGYDVWLSHSQFAPLHITVQIEVLTEDDFSDLPSSEREDEISMVP